MGSNGGVRSATREGAGADLDALAAGMQMLADGTRLKILLVLAEGEMHVTEMQSHLRCPQPTVSHHLGLLRMAGLVDARRHGKRVFYRLTNAAPAPGRIRVLAGGATIDVHRS
jgi:DNA-binding transcriptional ArsR family regulator